MDVKKTGRLAYIEPTNIGNANNGIPHKYEDYHMYVDFAVHLNSRKSCGQTENSNNRKVYSTENGSLRLMSGTNGVFTSNYTDIELNGKNVINNTNECVGVKDIHVSFDTNYVPYVTAKFVDVRGASFFSPQELNEMNKLSYNERFNYGNSVLKSIFQFPPADFYMTVKGFYGKPVKMKLIVADVKVSLEDESGDFEVDTKFIGKLFGVYTDLPFSLINYAPYMEYGGQNYWKNNLGGTFVYSDKKSPLLTFLEFRERVAKFNSFEPKSTPDNTKDFVNITAWKKNLEEIRAEYKKFLENTAYYLGDNGRVIYFDHTVYINDNREYDEIILTSDNSGDISNTFNKVKFDSLDEPYLYKNLHEMNRLIEQYDTQSGYSLGRPWFLPAESFVQQIDNDKILENVDIIKASSVVDEDTKEEIITYDIKNTNENYVTLNNKAKFIDDETEKAIRRYVAELRKDGNIISNTLTFKIAIISDHGYMRKLDTQINNLVEEGVENERDIPPMNSVEVQKALGFKPSIENIFKMIFAHMETFVQQFYNMLDNIKNSRRTISSLHLGGIETDLVVDSAKTRNYDTFVPPFPGIYKKVSERDPNSNTNVVKTVQIKPGERISSSFKFDGNSFEELKFVDSVFDAIRLYLRKEEELKNIEDQSRSIKNDMKMTGIVQYFPTNLFDICFGSYDSSPYKGKGLKMVSNDSILEYIDAQFFYRYYNSVLSFPIHEREISVNAGDYDIKSRLKKNRDIIGVLEGINLYNGLKPTKEIYEEIKKRYENKSGDNLLKELRTSCDKKIWGYPEDGKMLDYKNNVRGLKAIGEEGAVEYYFPIMSNDTEVIYDIRNSNDMGKNDSENNFWINLKNPERTKNSFWVSDSDIFSIKMPYDYLEKISETCNKIVKSISPFETISSSDVHDYFSGEGTFIEEEDVKQKWRLNVYSYSKTNAFGKRTSYDALDSYNAFYNGGFKANPEDYPIYVCSSVNIEGEKQNTKYPSIFFYDIYKKIHTLDVNKIMSYENRSVLKSEAYMFLFSIPISMAYLGTYNEQHRTYCSLLIEGAYYWRYDFMRENGDKDPIIGNRNNDKYKIPEKNEMYFLDNGNYDEDLYNSFLGFCLLKKDSEKKYFKPGYNPSQYRKKYLKQMFENWATGQEFGTILQYLNNPDEDNLNSISYKRVKNSKGKFLDGYGKKDEFFKGRWNTPKGREYITDIIISQDNEAADIIKKLFFKYYTVIDFSRMNIVPIEDDEFERTRKLFFKTFFKKCEEAIKNDTISKSPSGEDEDDTNQDSMKNDIKLSIYCLLKNLYEMHFCAENRNRWVIGSKISDFERFIYTDQYYNKIGGKIMLNATNVSENVARSTSLAETGDGFNTVNDSVFSFMGNISTKVGVAIYAFPIGNALLRPDTFRDMFRPMEMSAESMNVSDNYFLCQYNIQPSTILGNNTEFDDDGFDIADSLGNVNPISLPNAFSDVNGYTVPAFGVSYGKMNQSYFKGFRVNMDNYKQSAFQIAAEANVAAKAGDGPRETMLFGQDIYHVFSNYSYTCQITAMGNMQIVPGMIFQLNNIPMFKGAYMVFKVEHSIKPGDITTVFTGMRMKKTSVPYLKSPIFNLSGNTSVTILDIDEVSEDNRIMVNSTANLRNLSPERLVNMFYEPTDLYVSLPRNKYLSPSYSYTAYERRNGYANMNDPINYILSFEGGFSDDVADKGGATMCGITIATYRNMFGEDKTVGDLKRITEDEWVSIYKRFYWDNLSCGMIKNQSIANMLVDWGFNSGCGTVKRKISQIFNETSDDWPDVINNINNFKDKPMLFEKIKRIRGQFYLNLVKTSTINEKFLKGWLKRVDCLKYKEGLPCAPLSDVSGF